MGAQKSFAHAATYGEEIEPALAAMLSQRSRQSEESGELAAAGDGEGHGAEVSGPAAQDGNEHQEPEAAEESKDEKRIE